MMNGFKILGIIIMITVLVSLYELGLFIASDFVIDNTMGAHMILTCSLFLFTNLIVGLVLNELAKLGKGLIK